MNGIIIGTSLLRSTIPEGWTVRHVTSHYGKISLFIAGDSAILQRHGHPPLPPHKINHRANLQGLRSLGVYRIISINSVGSLKRSVPPGTLLVPHDFMSPWSVPTFFDDEMRFTIPSMETETRKRLIETCRAISLPVIDSGIYIQTTGPRLETKAEIEMFRQFGDVVGMTMANEATLSAELAIPYASICSVDNYCNGIVPSPLTMDEIASNVRKNAEMLEHLIEELIIRGF